MWEVKEGGALKIPDIDLGARVGEELRDGRQVLIGGPMRDKDLIGDRDSEPSSCQGRLRAISSGMVSPLARPTATTRYCLPSCR